MDDDPSSEWVYDAARDMWISYPQGIAIEGALFRRVVTISSNLIPRDEDGEDFDRACNSPDSNLPA